MNDSLMDQQPPPSEASDMAVDAIDIPTVEIHPEGNVLLICGSTTKKKLRVNSSVMSMASPVFRAMLSERFKEGTTLANTSSVEIPLPDDDPEAMESICNVFHLRNDHAAITLEDRGKMTARQVLTIAILCDKYQCQVAVAAAATCWLYFCENDNSKDLHMLVTAAYHFRIRTAFCELGELVVGGRVAGLAAHEDGEVLSDVLGQLIERRRLLYDEIILSIEHELTNIMSKRSSRSRRGNPLYFCDPSCTFTEVAIATLLAKLRDEQLWPSRMVSSRSLSSLIDDLKAFQYHWDPRVARCAGTRCVKEVYAGLGLTNFRSEAAEITKKMRGPCLECYLEKRELGLDVCGHGGSDK